MAVPADLLPERKKPTLSVGFVFLIRVASRGKYPMKATIRWKTRDEGGRSATLILEENQQYISMIDFPGEPLPKGEAWSVGVLKVRELDPLNWIVDVKFLAEAAPSERLRSRCRFELREGKRTVAEGVFD